MIGFSSKCLNKFPDARNKCLYLTILIELLYAELILDSSVLKKEEIAKSTCAIGI